MSKMARWPQDSGLLIRQAIQSGQAFQSGEEGRAVEILNQLQQQTTDAFKLLTELLSLTTGDFLREVWLAGLDINHGMNGTFLLAALETAARLPKPKPEPETNS